MYWQRLTNRRLQQILPFRVFPQNTQKHASIPTKDHLKYGFFMENFTELHKKDNSKLSKDAK